MVVGGLRMIFTVGHSTREVADVEEMLERRGVTVLVDVRSYPSSRRYPQWNRDTLQDALGVKYEWWGGILGGRRKALPAADSVNGGWRNDSFRGYADWMQGDDFRRGADDLALRSTGEVLAIMCSEAVWWRCHRRMVADAMVARGVAVEHIMGLEASTPHELTAFARVEGEALWYPDEDRVY